MVVNLDELKIEELRQRYLQMIDKPDVFPARANWQFITAHKMQGLCAALFNKYITALTVDDSDRHELHEIAIEQFPVYIAAIDRSEATAVIYPYIDVYPEIVSELIRKANLFDAKAIERLIDAENLSLAVYLLDVYQSEYTQSDLVNMRQLASRLSELPERGYITEVKGIFGNKQKYVCPNGHYSNPDSIYCSNQSCRCDKRGLTPEQNEKINIFNNRIKALQALFSKTTPSVMR